MALKEAGPQAPSGRHLLRELMHGDGVLARRFQALRSFSRRVRTSEYHLTNACNLRCHGCWFFEYGFDDATHELTSSEGWRLFAKREAEERGITASLLIGGEPALYPERVAAFVDAMEFVTISSNGLKALPRAGFEEVCVALTVFGGGAADDRLRAIKPSGQRFEGLLDQVLANYRDDPRAIFILALDPEDLSDVEDTVKRIGDNGNNLSFNYYSEYGEDDPLRKSAEASVLETALAMRERYPEVVVSDEYYIRTLVTGRTEWAEFGYEVCPSISSSLPIHEERLQNGNPVLPGFDSVAADAQTRNFCCASGRCEGCRDSQAMYSWLLLSLRHFLDSPERVETWVEVAESYWSQFIWAPYHRTQKERGGRAAAEECRPAP